MKTKWKAVEGCNKLELLTQKPAVKFYVDEIMVKD